MARRRFALIVLPLALTFLTLPASIAARTHHGANKSSRQAPGDRTQAISLPLPMFFVSPTGRAPLTRSSPNHPASLAAALLAAPAGTVVHLAAGSYPAIHDGEARRRWVTLSGAGDAHAPRIAGALLFGTRFLRFVHVEFSSVVFINSGYVGGLDQTADHIEILNSEFDCGSATTSPFTTAIFVRDAARNLTFSGDRVVHCVVGFGSLAQAPVSAHVRITHCTFEDLTGDAIDLGGLDDVVIDHNIIRDIADPSNLYHDDGIQFFGNDENVQITNNVLANSRDQLILIQDAVKSDITGSRVSGNILVAHNVIYGAGTYAVLDQGGLDVNFVGNTIWNNHFGSMLVTKSYFTGREPTLTLTDNVIQGLTYYDAGPQYENYNLLTDVPTRGHSWGQNDILNVNPLFVDAGEGDFQLLPLSPGLDRGDRAAAHFSAALAPDLGTDMFGKNLANPFANLGALQPGDPPVAYGALRFGPPPLS